MRSIVYPLQLILIISLSGFWLTVQASENEEFSEANNLLFTLDHLGNITTPASLNYHFVKSGTVESGFEDDIKLNYKPAKSVENRGVEVTLFSGDRNRWTPGFNGSKGNPLLTIFLQRDIHEMNRLTDGLWRHFQKRIKLSLENNAKIQAINFEFDGKQYQGKEIIIHPYLDDPYNKRFKKYAGKYYIFTLSDSLPGMLYQIRAVTPGEGKNSGGKKPALLSEVVTLTAATLN